MFQLKTDEQAIPPWEKGGKPPVEYTWEEFVNYRDKLINVIDTKTLKDEFKLETF